MGWLAAARFLPSLLLGLPAGAWVDRLPPRPLLIATDLGRGLVLALVPLQALACCVVDAMEPGGRPVRRPLVIEGQHGPTESGVQLDIRGRG